MNATLLTLVVYLLPSLYSSAVVEWLYSAAYVWILLYMAFHLLALANRYRQPGAVKTFRTPVLWIITVAGVISTAIGLYYAFAGAHLQYGAKALIVLLAAPAAASVSFIMPRYEAGRAPAEQTEIREAA